MLPPCNVLPELVFVYATNLFTMKKYYVLIAGASRLNIMHCKKQEASCSFTELWQLLQTPYFGEPLDIKFTSTDSGYILGVEIKHVSGSIYNILTKTDDGGNTWQSIAYIGHKFLTDTSYGVMSSIYVSPFNSDILFSGRNNLLRS